MASVQVYIRKLQCSEVDCCGTGLKAFPFGSASSPFSLLKIAQVIGLHFYSQMSEEMGDHHLWQKKSPSDIRFSFRWIAKGATCFILTSSILWSPSVPCLRTLSKLRNLMYRTNVQPHLDVCWSTQNLTPRKFETSHLAPASFEKFLQDNVCIVFSKSIVEIPTQFVLWYVASRPDAEWVHSNPSVRYTRR